MLEVTGAQTISKSDSFDLMLSYCEEVRVLGSQFLSF